MNSIRLNSIPTALRWTNPPLEWRLEHQNTLIITAGKSTDLFNDPQGTPPTNNSPRLTFEAQGNFILSAKVAVDFQATFDAGTLLIYGHDNLWAKLCFEFSPQKQPMIVTVVTRQLSDDCNSVIIDGNQIYLRIAKVNQAFAFHFSEDGQVWHLVRYFSLGKLDNMSVGFTAQSPTGEMCTATFSEVDYVKRLLKNIRSGE